MSLPAINITVTDGNLGRPLIGRDHYTGLVVVGSTDAPVTQSSFGSVTEFRRSVSATASPITTALADSYFQKCPGGFLYVSTTTQSADFSAVVSLGRYAKREIRQFAVYDAATFSISRTNLLNDALTTLRTERAPAPAIYANPLTGTYAALPDATQTGNYPIFGCYMRDSRGYPALGQLAGVLAANNVAHSPAWTVIGNLDTSTVSVGALGDGTPLANVSDSTLADIASKGWITPRSWAGLAGHFPAKSKTFANDGSDFDRIQNVRVLMKAERLIYSASLPFIDSPLIPTSSGDVSEHDASHIENTISEVLNQMVTAVEIASCKVYVPRTQTVFSDGHLQINYKIQVIGSAEILDGEISLTRSI